MKQNITKHSAAQNLYFQTNYTYKKIAKLSGISTKTLYLWIKKGNWQRIKQSVKYTPATLVEKFLAQLQDLNTNIEARPVGQRHATDKEMEIIRKLTGCVRGMRYEVALPATIDILTNFILHLQHVNPELAIDVSYYMQDYLTCQANRTVLGSSLHYKHTNELEQEAVDNFNDSDDEQLEQSLLSPEELEEILSEQVEHLTHTSITAIGNQSVTNEKYGGNKSETIGNNQQPTGNTINSLSIT